MTASTNNFTCNKERTKKTFVIIALCIAVFVYVKPTSSQVSEQWKKTYSGESYGHDILNDMTVDNAGNVYITGQSEGPSTAYDYGTIKYNSNGVQQWVSRYNGLPQTDIDAAYAVTTDNAGNVYVTGYTSNPNLTGKDITTIKYNSAGAEIWIKMYNSSGTQNEEGNDVALDNAGNVYVTGHTLIGGNNYDIITIKYNSAGVQQWVKTYNSGGTNVDRGNSIIADGAGNVYVAGTANSNSVIVKYNTSGTQLWAAAYNGPGNAADNFWKIALDVSGNVYASGESFVSGNNDYALVKFNSAGTQLWAKNYAGPGNGEDKIKGLYVDAAGNIYVTGESKGVGSDKDYATIKYNSAGTQQWAARYNGPDNLADEGFGVTADADGNVYVTGRSKGSATSYDFATLKYNSAGVQQWVMRHNGPANDDDYGKFIAIDNLGNVVVSGGCSIQGGDDYCTIKYTPLTGIQINGSEIPDSYSLSQNYPNPFNPSTNINFSIPAAENVKITVFDMLGREISVIANEYLSAGNYHIDFNASALASGTYFYKMTSGDFTDIKKLVVVK